MGIKGYDGEKTLWINEKNPDVGHIVIRIEEELKKLNEKKVDFYLYGTKEKKTRKYFKNLIPNQQDIDIYFVLPEQKKIQVFPNPSNLSWVDNPERFKGMEETFGMKEIPFPMRLWLGDEDIVKKTQYRGLVIKDFKHVYNEVLQIQAIIANNKKPFNNLGKTSGFLLSPKPNDPNVPIIKKTVIAQAKLCYPYISMVYKDIKN